MPGRYQFSLPERPARDGWFRIGTLDITTTALLVGLGVISMFVYAIDGASGAFMKLPFVAPWVRDGDLWRLITWPIANPPNRFWVLLTLAFFWFVGHRVEDTIGRRRFTIMIVLMTILPAALVTAFDFTSETGIAYGLGILAIALLVVYAFDSPGAIWFFGVPLWVVAVAFVALDALQYLGDRMFGALLVELGAVVVGTIAARQFGMLNDMPFIPRLAGKSRGGGRRSGPTRSRSTKGSKVVPGPWAPQAEPGLTAAEHSELDDLLDKTNERGLDSLSRAEKARLNDLSKKLRSR